MPWAPQRSTGTVLETEVVPRRQGVDVVVDDQAQVVDVLPRPVDLHEVETVVASMRTLGKETSPGLPLLHPFRREAEGADVERQRSVDVGDVEDEVVEADHTHVDSVPRYGRGMAEDAGNPLAQVFGRLGLSGDQLSSLQSQLGRVMPAEQLKLMRDLVDTFSPSGDQLDGHPPPARGPAGAGRGHAGPARGHGGHARPAWPATAEQLHAMQEPFHRLTQLFNPGSPRRSVAGVDVDGPEELLAGDVAPHVLPDPRRQQRDRHLRGVPDVRV